MNITRKYLQMNPDHIFVFGDNVVRKGTGGAAILRTEPNTYGFITKKYPNNQHFNSYKPQEYLPVFENELKKLINCIETYPNKTFLISKIGSGLANTYNIFEQIIEPRIHILKKYNNVKFLW